MFEKYYNSIAKEWISSEQNTSDSNFELDVKSKLKSALQMPNIMVLAGSGTSLGDIVQGPKMWDLWQACISNDMDIIAKDCFDENKYDVSIKTNQNIEECLSYCEAYSQVSKTKDKNSSVH